MKPSDVNHLRRLLAWVKCETPPAPERIEEAVRDTVAKLPDTLSDEGKQRLVEWHDEARRVPKYVRAAVTALEKVVAVGPVINEAATASDALPARYAALEAECLEEARANGAGAEREAALQARVAQLEHRISALTGLQAGWRLMPVTPTSKQVVMMACEIKGRDENGCCHTVGDDWPEHVATAERVYAAAMAEAPTLSESLTSGAKE